VVPQLVPRFLAYILYQWDINIRMSTVIGFAGGGGLGQQMRIWTGWDDYGAVGVAVWAIVVMVWSMDYVSAKARERLT
jgi:phosphonate transport system permease protein